MSKNISYIEDVLDEEDMAAEDEDRGGLLNRLKSSAKELLYTLKNNKLSTAAAIAGIAADRYTTWLVLGNVQNSYEGNVIAAEGMRVLGMLPAFATTAAGVMLLGYFGGKVLGGPKGSSSFPKNLYRGVGLAEGVVALSNYLVYTSHASLFSGFGEAYAAFIGLASIPFIASYVVDRIKQREPQARRVRIPIESVESRNASPSIDAAESTEEITGL